MNSHPRLLPRFRRCALVVAVVAVPAPAQVLEEVIVTAQKREQEIQDVGISISAFTGEQLDTLGFVESTEIAAMTPGVHVSASSAGQTRQFTIRGVTQNDFADHTEAPNAVYVDEGYVAAPQGQVFGLFDLERVEVLKGPQGTLFGRNATGGLVHYISKLPTQETDASVRATYGRYDQVRVEGAVGGGLTPSLAGRVAVLYNRHDDITNNVYPFGQPTDPLSGAPLAGSRSGASDEWNDDQVAIRARLLWNVSDSADLLLTGFYSEQNVSTPPYQSVGSTAVVVPVAPGNNLVVNSIFARQDLVRNCEAINANTGGCVGIAFVDGEIPGVNEDGVRPRPGGDFFGYIDPDGKDFDLSKDHALDDFNEYKVYGGTAKLSWDLGAFDLTAISHFMHFDKLQTLDAEASPAPAFNFNGTSDHDSFTQELRLNGELDHARWVVGFYYLWIDTHFEEGLSFQPASPFTTLFFGGLPVETDLLIDLKTNSYSLFGQLEYDLTDRLRFLAGLRTIWEKKSYDYVNNIYPNNDDARLETDLAPILPFLAYPSFEDKDTSTLWTGKLQLEFRPTEDWLVFAGINRGVKAGSFNAKLNDFASPALAPDDIPYSEEVLLAYEVGFKSTLFNGTTRVNGTFYYYDYDDYQAFVFQLASGVIRNADATYKGVELEVITSPIENFDLAFNASLIDATIDGLEVAPGFVRDVTPTFTPQVQLAGLARYEWPAVLFGGSVALQLEGNYASNAFHNIRNFQSHKMDAYVIGNARASWRSADDHWQVSAFVTNFTDSRYQITGFELSAVCGCTEEGYGAPRWWGITVGYDW